MFLLSNLFTCSSSQTSSDPMINVGTVAFRFSNYFVKYLRPQVAGLVNFSLRVSGFTFKQYGFSGYEMYQRLRVWPFLCGWVSCNSFKLSIFSGFRSHTVQVAN